MPFNILLLPLLGGFIFVSRWHKVKYKALRLDGHRLLFAAAIWGIVLLAIAEGIVVLLSPLLPWAITLWNQYSPFEYSGRAMLAFVLGFIIPFLFNRFIDENDEINKVIAEREDPLELLLRSAMGERRMVSITVKNGKVYVGFVTSNFNPVLPMQSVAILPASSGYRDEKMRIEFTTDYSAAYDPIREEIRQAVIQEYKTQNNLPAEANIDVSILEERIKEMTDEALRDFEVIIPIVEIQSVNIFDVNAYKKYFPRIGTPTPTGNAQTNT